MTGHVSIKLASERVNHCVAASNELPRFYTPGEVISGMKDYMRGHGTYTEDDCLKSSVAGVMQKRRRSAEDEQMMRKHLQEGDLISAEVQSIFSDGSLSLHTRSLKYGKLLQGTLVKVFPSLIKRRKNHFHNLPCGISVIIGNNGYIWISPQEREVLDVEVEDEKDEIQNYEMQPVNKSDRDTIARVKNCIAALVASKMMLDDTSIMFAYEESLKYEDVKELLDPEAMLDVAFLTQHRINTVMEE
ncbi:unnamed protein product, partial [Iphiclides podalirius]